MINKYAEINDRILLYNACKGILRVKTARLEKRAFEPISGAVVGGSLGAAGGYYGGRALARKLGLDDKSWKSRVLRYGGGTIGGIGGAAGGWFAVPYLASTLGAGAGISAAASGAGTAARAASVGSKALKALNTASNISTAVDAAKSLKGAAPKSVATTVAPIVQ